MSDGSPKLIAIDEGPITTSCMRAVLEKQIVRRTNRLIRVRKLMCLLSIFCVFSFQPCASLSPHALVGTPAVGEIARDAKGLSQRFERQKTVSSVVEHIG